MQWYYFLVAEWKRIQIIVSSRARELNRIWHKGISIGVQRRAPRWSALNAIHSQHRYTFLTDRTACNARMIGNRSLNERSARHNWAWYVDEKEPSAKREDNSVFTKSESNDHLSKTDNRWQTTAESQNRRYKKLWKTLQKYVICDQ